MAFSSGAGGNDKVNATINIVPLVDVMLVLLIIFRTRSRLSFPKPTLTTDPTAHRPHPRSPLR